MTRSSITAVILCLNEEENIEDCIKSVSWCDEVIVVDSGSTDNTKILAKRLGSRVVERIQDGKFIITDQRNWVIKSGISKTEWILFIDADERIGTACRDEILAKVQEDVTTDGYEMAPRFWFLGKWLKRTQGYPNWHPRLIRNGSIYFTGGVWESFEAGKNISRIHEPYEHYAFSKGLNDWLARHMRYSDWEAEKVSQFLLSNDLAALDTNRRLPARWLAARLWRVRPYLRFIHKYIVQRGFMDGAEGYIYCQLMFVYELMTVVKIIERRRVGMKLGND